MKEAEKEAGGASLKQMALRAASWSVAGRFMGQGLRLLSNIILARLLFPEAFGLMAIVAVFIFGLKMFSDLGVGPSIVYDARGEDDAFLDTAWTINIIRGAIITLGALLLAWPVAQIYGEPQLTSLLSVVGLSGVISGFESTSLHTEQRKLELGRVIKLELFSQVVRFVVMVAWAVVSPSVWALVAGSLLGTTSKTVLSHYYLPQRKHRVHWEPEAVRSVFRFGSWIFLSSSFTFIGVQGDRLLLGYYLGVALLGVYHVATRFTEALGTLQGRLTRSVLFPVFSETNRSEPERLVKRYYKTRLYMDLLFLSAGGLMCTTGSLIIGLLYDDRYQEAGWILQALAIQVSMSIILTPGETVLFAVGKTFYGAARSFAKSIWILVGIPLGWHWVGLPGVVWCVALSEVPVLVIIWFGMSKQGLLRPLLELRSLGIWATAAGLGWLIAAAVQ
jgi:O-antigen/teichoic acid export membrane protein